MNIDDLTLGQIKEIKKLVGESTANGIDNNMIGKYVIARCRDAGVHAGVLESYNGRECVLLRARRLWYWKPANKQSFLSGIATHGLDSSSKIGAAVIRIHLTEDCELIQCDEIAEKSIQGAPSHEQ